MGLQCSHGQTWAEMAFIGLANTMAAPPIDIARAVQRGRRIWPGQSMHTGFCFRMRGMLADTCMLIQSHRTAFILLTDKASGTIVPEAKLSGHSI
jgi:hypothetical protein